MIDRLFTALLTFALLAGAATAIGTALLEPGPATRVVTLPAVTVVGHREAAALARDDAREPATTQLR